MIGYILISTAVFLLLLKLYNKCTIGVCQSQRLLHGKTAIVTGSNTGIGKETARDLAKRGARVILACRDQQKGLEARDEIIRTTGNKNVILHLVDLSSLASVRKFAENIKKSENCLDILVNNAGVVGLPPKFTKDNLLIGMHVNHFGPFLLTLLLLDLLKKSAPSRIVMVSSVAHIYAKLSVDTINEKDDNGLRVYANSKLCNILFANELSHRLMGTGVTVNSLHPGIVKTDIFRRLPRFIMLTINYLFGQFGKTAYEGAQTSIYLAVSEDVEGVTGKYFADCKEAQTSSSAQDEELARKIWIKSEILVGLKPEEKYW
ncbi:retinol dehydrogenase 14-like isoform X3 [Schistocerca gregaria]|uniref:retinol dehydrogenase 14-like isoform X3 n=1 Tax=Schistocerca gregaria TaxID=7010 RepID=UPI00211E833F|nr:retinol dehydrogenase 14-like isoform X3 [Schistocerca gregaria]